MNKLLLLTELTPELERKAEIEVNEKQNWRERDIEALRQIVLNDITLNSQYDDAFLLRFLRARMFDYEKAYDLIKKYYYLKAHNSELFVPPNRLKYLFDTNIMCVLPHNYCLGQTVLVLSVGRWCTRLCSFDSLLAGCIASFETAIMSEITQINGIICIVDMNEFGWSQLRRFGPSQAKKLVHIIDECLPIRIKAIHVINESTIADIAFTIIKPFLSEDLRNKFTFHGSDITQLHSIISPEFLSSDINGVQDLIDASKWFDEIISSEEYLITNWENYGFKKCVNISDESIFNTIDTNLFRKSQTCNGYLFNYYKPSKAE